MAHTKKRQTLKLKKKLSMEANIKARTNFQIISDVNDYINHLNVLLAKRIDFFQKDLKKLEDKTKKLQAQETKAAARLIALEKKAAKKNIPAAKQRAKAIHRVMIKLNKENNALQKAISLAKSSLNHFASELNKLKGLKKVVGEYHKTQQSPLKKAQPKPIRKFMSTTDEKDTPIFDKAFEVSPNDVIDDSLHKNFSDDFDLRMDVLTEGGRIRKRMKKLDVYSDELLIEESRARGELSDDDLLMTDEIRTDDIQPEVT